MKRTMICFLLLISTASSFGQQTEPNTSQTIPDIDYLKKSKHQKTAAWILTGAGTAGLLVTLIADASQAVGGGLTYAFSLGTVEPEYKSYTAYYLLSAACVGTGIALFIAASKNKKRAIAMDASTCLKMEGAPMLLNAGLTKQSYPAVAIRINLQ